MPSIKTQQLFRFWHSCLSLKERTVKIVNVTQLALPINELDDGLFTQLVSFSATTENTVPYKSEGTHFDYTWLSPTEHIQTSIRWMGTIKPIATNNIRKRILSYLAEVKAHASNHVPICCIRALKWCLRSSKQFLNK